MFPGHFLSVFFGAAAEGVPHMAFARNRESFVGRQRQKGPKFLAPSLLDLRRRRHIGRLGQREKLNQEWRKNASEYEPVLKALDTPFSRSNTREKAWEEYNALLLKRTYEGIYDEKFGLAQVFVSPNAYKGERK